MTQRVVLFNGPPGCGKDTAARYCFDHLGRDYFASFDRMSMPIKKAFAATVALPIDKWGNVDFWEKRKEETIPGFGVSYRQWQIDFSERFMKPLYGEAIFGRLFVSRNKRQHKAGIILVPDCGFDIEYTTLSEAFGVKNVLVVKIYRPGHDYSKDSRNYLKVGSDFISDEYNGGPSTASNVRHVTNSGTREEFEAKVLPLIKEWLNGGPK